MFSTQVIAKLEEGLEGKGIKAKVIYSGDADVDILANKASKGAGLQFLLGQVGGELQIACYQTALGSIWPTSTFSPSGPPRGPAFSPCSAMCEKCCFKALINLDEDTQVRVATSAAAETMSSCIFDSNAKNICFSTQIEKGAGLPLDCMLVCGDSSNNVELVANYSKP